MEINELRIGNIIETNPNQNDVLKELQSFIEGDKINNYEKVMGIIPFYEPGATRYKLLTTDINPNSYTFSKEIIVNNKSIGGIPLTEEWLLKFGFERFRGMYKPFELPGNYNPSFQITDEKTNGNEIVYLTDCDDGRIGNPILYVHQLQNLYFALTGKELEIK